MSDSTSQAKADIIEQAAKAIELLNNPSSNEEKKSESELKDDVLSHLNVVDTPPINCR